MSLLFCNISWMREYQGCDREPKDIPQRGGRWVEENGTAGECCNFLPDKNGKVYGYVETWNRNKGRDRQIDIKKLGANKSSMHVDGIDVIWIATHENRGRRVVGWYKNATVYRKRQKHSNNNYPTKQHEKDRVNSYIISATEENVYLISEDDRNLELDQGRRRRGWPGQNPLFYPDEHRNNNQELETFIQQLQKYINTKGKTTPHNVVKEGKRNGKLNREEVFAIEQVAIDKTCKFYEEQGYELSSVEVDNVGWDIEATKGKEKLLIEVKGHKGNVIQFELTPNEYKQLQNHTDKYRVCVVLNALSKPDLIVFLPKKEKGNWLLNEIGGNKKVRLNERIAAKAEQIS